MDNFRNLENLEKLAEYDSELVILGTILDNQVNSTVLDGIDSNIFSVEHHKKLFEVMRSILNNNETLDFRLVAQRLKKVNSPFKVTDLTNLLTYSNKYTFKQHLDTLTEVYLKRKVYERAVRLSEGILEGGDITKLMYDFEEDTKEDKDINEHDDNIQSIVTKLLDDLENPVQEIIKFNIPFLDEKIGGIFPGELTTIGAKSGCGKSTLALQIIKSTLEQNKRVLLITREMTDKHMVQRLITQVTGLQSKAMKTRDLKSDDWEKVIQGMEWLGNKQLFINDTISKPSEIRRRVKQIKPDVVVIDYLQLLTSEKTNQGREQEVAYLSREMRKISLDFNCHVVQLTQLNDSFKGCPMGESAVRESRSIFHDSSNVIYLHKPMEYMELLQLANDNEQVAKVWLDLNLTSDIKLMQLVVAKSRDAGNGISKVWFVGSQLTFKDFDLKNE